MRREVREMERKGWVRRERTLCLYSKVKIRKISVFASNHSSLKETKVYVFFNSSAPFFIQTRGSHPF